MKMNCLLRCLPVAATLLALKGSAGEPLETQQLPTKESLAGRSAAVNEMPRNGDAVKALEPYSPGLPERPLIRFTKVGSLEAKESRGGGVRFSPDGRLLATGWGGGCTVEWQGTEIVYSKADVGIWDLQTRRLLRVLPHPERHLAAYAFVPPGDRLVTACCDLNKVFLWDVKSGRLLDTLDTGGNPTYYLAVTDLAAFPDGKRVLCCAATGLIVWDIEKKTQSLLPLEEYLPLSPSGARPVPKTCHGAKFTADGTRFATTLWEAPNFAKRIFLWDAKTCQITRVIPVKNLNPVFAYSPDGQFVVAKYYEPDPEPLKVGVWETAGGRLVLCGQLFNWGTLVLTFTSDSKYLIACGVHRSPGSEIPAGGVWEVASGKFVSHLPYGSAAVSPDNRILAVGRRFVELYAIEYLKEPTDGGPAVQAKP